MPRSNPTPLQTPPPPPLLIHPWVFSLAWANRPAYTPQHKSTWKYSHTNTLTPMLILPAAYKPHSLLDCGRKNGGSTKGPKVQKHGVTVFR